MDKTVVNQYFEEVCRNKGKWIHQTYPIDRGIKLKVSPDQIALALVNGGYYNDLKDAKRRVKRHLMQDTKEKRAERCIVSLREFKEYLVMFNLQEPDSRKGYS